MPLGWESNAKYAVDSAKLEGGGKLHELGVGNPRAPHPLYETLGCQAAIKKVYKVWEFTTGSFN